MDLDSVPVLVLAYKRYVNLSATLSCINDERNVLIVIDGPKSDIDKANVELTYAVAHKFAYGKPNVQIIKRQYNMGGPKGIPESIKIASEKWSFFCILEEDCMPLHPSFLSYADLCLSHYKTTGSHVFYSLFNPFSNLLSPGYASFPLIWGWCASSDLFREYLSFRGNCCLHPQQASFSRLYSSIALSCPALKNRPFDRLIFAFMQYSCLRGSWPNWDGYLVAYALLHDVKTLYPPTSLIINTGVGLDSQNTKKPSPFHLYPLDLSCDAGFEAPDFDVVNSNDRKILSQVFRHSSRPLPIVLKLFKFAVFK